MPLLSTWAPEEYGGNLQSWSVVQDARGILFFANNNGVLEYDGVEWSLTPVDNRSLVRSLAVDAAGTVWVGAQDELGYVRTGELGGTTYVSLVDHLPADGRGLGNFWETYTHGDAVYFNAFRKLLRWQDGVFTTIDLESRVGLVGGRIYANDREVGLHILRQDSFEPVEGGEALAGKSFSFLLPHGEDSMLAGTRRSGLYLLSSTGEGRYQSRSWPTEVDVDLIEHGLYHGVQLPSGDYALATIGAGVLVVDAQGALVHRLDKSFGLPEESVWYLHADREGDLWLAMDEGLAQVELSSPLTRFDARAGLDHRVQALARHAGRMHAATSNGLYRLSGRRFERLPGLRGLCWSLLSYPTEQGPHLLAGTHEGIFLVDGDQIIQLRRDPAFVLHASIFHPGTVYVGGQTGLAVIRYQDGQWRDEGPLRGVGEIFVRSMAEESASRLWLGTPYLGALRLDMSPSGPQVTALKEGDDGRPMSRRAVVRRYRDKILFGTESGLFELDPADDRRLIRSRMLRSRWLRSQWPSAGSPDIVGLETDSAGNLWYCASRGGCAPVARAGDGGHHENRGPLRRLADEEIFTLLPEAGGQTWLGTRTGLYRFDPPTAGRQVPATLATLIRKVRVPAVDGADRMVAVDRHGIVLDYERREVVLDFALASYVEPERHQYSTLLEGYDERWSDWAEETSKWYTNLSEGRYRFRVRGRDILGAEGSEASFSFVVLPPWWRTWWAYGGYFLLIACAIWAAYRAHQRKLEREQRVNRQLREVDRLKDEFLAATSHELRTPLYGITGLVESLADGTKGELPAAASETLDMVAASSRRLSRLVDDILDFSKLRRASLALDRRPVELHALVDIVLTLSRPLITDKDLELENAVTADLPATLADENRVQQVLHNLVGNAIKFTEAGRVEVKARAEGGRLVVEVADTGIGVPEQHRERIFDAFEQGEGAIDRRFGGTGLGLAVSRQLVELHGGKLWLESTSTAGSTFAFTLPIAEGTAIVEGPTAVEAPVLLTEPPPSSGLETGDVATIENSGVRVAEAEGISILVVDDEPVNRQVLANQLGAIGYHVVLAGDGPEALRRIEERSFDLVLLDVMMPRMSGYEVCRELRRHHPAQELPVLFLTAKARQEDQVAGLAEGANDYLTKPVSKDTLLARVRTHVELLEAHRKQLAGLLPICAQCKKVRDDDGYWKRIETFFMSRSDLLFSHGLCPDCVATSLDELDGKA